MEEFQTNSRISNNANTHIARIVIFHLYSFFHLHILAIGHFAMPSFESLNCVFTRKSVWSAAAAATHTLHYLFNSSAIWEKEIRHGYASALESSTHNVPNSATLNREHNYVLS